MEETKKIEEKKYKVTNKFKDVRKFRDSFLGKDIFVGPKKFILTNKPPKESEVWKVETVEELEKKTVGMESTHKIIKLRRLKNDSSSSR